MNVLTTQIGNTILNGSGPPSHSIGTNGDFYIDKSAIDIYGPKTLGMWGSGTHLTGGVGGNSNKWTSGSGAPVADGTSNGDMYLDYNNADIYQWDGGIWTFLLNIEGPAGTAGAAGTAGVDGTNGTNGTNGIDGTSGPTGPTGPTGPSGTNGIDGINGTNGATGPPGSSGVNGSNGIDGNTILYASGVPTTQGINGNFYIDITNHDFYGPKASGVWPSGIHMIGAAGTNGTNGATGATGPSGPTGPTGPIGPTGPAGSLLGGALTSSQIIVGNASNLSAAVAMTGAVAIDNAGVTSMNAANANTWTANQTFQTIIFTASIPGNIRMQNAISGDGDVLGFNGANGFSGGNTNGGNIAFTPGSGFGTGHNGYTIFSGKVGIHQSSPGSDLDVKGEIRISGTTSGYVGFKGALAAGTTTYTLPSADGSAGQVLSTSGGTILSWVPPMPALPDSNIWIGNVSNVAIAVAVTGDVTITNAGVTAIGSNKVLYGQIQQASANTIVGNYTGSTANVREITLGLGLSFVGSALASSPIGTPLTNSHIFVGNGGVVTDTAVSGDITINVTGVTAIGVNKVTYAQFQQVATVSLVGNPTGILANAQAITLGSSLGFSGSTLGVNFGSTSSVACVGNDSRLSDARTPAGTALGASQILVGNASNLATAVAVTGDVTINSLGATAIGTGKVTLSKIASITASSLLGNAIGTPNSPTPITLGAGLSFVGSVLTPTCVGTPLTATHILVGDVSGLAADVLMSGDVTITNVGVVTIGANKVTYAKLQTVAASSLIGNSTGSTANAQGITLAASLGFVSSVLGVNFGATSTTACVGNDSRLSDFRTPVGSALTSANVWIGSVGNVAAAVAVTGDVTITNAGVTALGVNVVHATMLNADVFGSTSSTACVGNDSRLSDFRTPVGSALPIAQIWVGSVGAVAAAVAVTGDVTIGNTGITAIGANKVTYAKFQAIPANSLVGNFTGGSANVNTVILGAGLSFVSNVLTPTCVGTPLTATHIFVGSAGGTAADVLMSGDVTIVSSGVVTIGANKVTYAKLQTVAAASLIGNSTGSLANAQGITLGSGLAFSGTTLVVSINGLTSGTVAVLDQIPLYNQATTANRKVTVEQVLLLLGRGYIDGLILSIDGGTSDTIDISAGVCVDSANAVIFKLAAFIKKLSATWVVGSGNGGLFTGTIAASTVYHVFLIRNNTDASIDAGFDTSLTAANIPTGYTAYRRVGSVITDGTGHIIAFHQYGNEFWWDTSILDINVTNPGTAAVTRTLSVPTGIKVKAILTAYLYDNTAYTALYLSCLDSADLTASATTAVETEPSATVAEGAQEVQVWTNTSAQIRSRLGASIASTTLKLRTKGWIDLRGKDQ